MYKIHLGMLTKHLLHSTTDVKDGTVGEIDSSTRDVVK